MADDAVVDAQTQDPTTTGQKPETTDSQKPQAQSTQVTAPDRKAEDERQRGILADLQKERKQRQDLERQITAHKTELEAERRRVQALVGVNPKSAEDTQVEEVRAQFAKLFPGLAKLTEEQIDRVLKVAETSGTLEETTKHYWVNHSRGMLSSLNEAVADEIGGELTERQQKVLAAAYVREAENDPEFMKRHDAGDKTLITEFVKQWVEDWFKPVQRQITAQEVGRARRVPSGKDRSINTGAPKKIDFKDPKAVEDAMVESFKSHGGVFGK